MRCSRFSDKQPQAFSSLATVAAALQLLRRRGSCSSVARSSLRLARSSPSHRLSASLSPPRMSISFTLPLSSEFY
ncbi:unnamed protein product [Ixodes pacificus]